MAICYYGPNGETITLDDDAVAPEGYADTPAKARALELGVKVSKRMSNEDIVAACELAAASPEEAGSDIEEPATEEAADADPDEVPAA